MGILQARILEWVVMPSSSGSSQARDWAQSPELQADSLPSEPPGKPRILAWEAYGEHNLPWIQIWPLWQSLWDPEKRDSLESEKSTKEYMVTIDNEMDKIFRTVWSPVQKETKTAATVPVNGAAPRSGNGDDERMYSHWTCWYCHRVLAKGQVKHAGIVSEAMGYLTGVGMVWWQLFSDLGQEALKMSNITVQPALRHCLHSAQGFKVFTSF